ncbi:hypothetical protein Hanom_Chr07g00654541 [Helianthus anomalus]
MMVRDPDPGTLLRITICQRNKDHWLGSHVFSSFLSSFSYSVFLLLCFYFSVSMLLRNSPQKDHKKNSPLKSQRIIKYSPTERCCFTDAHIDRIRHCFPADAVFKSFTPTALSDFISDTWVAFPATPFTIGYSYPFPRFTQSFFSFTGISYIQAMPMIWRVLYTLERIVEQKGIDLGMAELAEMYDLTTFGSHRYLRITCV